MVRAVRIGTNAWITRVLTEVHVLTVILTRDINACVQLDTPELIVNSCKRNRSYGLVWVHWQPYWSAY